jgi:hypothetical protein
MNDIDAFDDFVTSHEYKKFGSAYGAEVIAYLAKKEEEDKFLELAENASVHELAPMKPHRIAYDTYKTDGFSHRTRSVDYDGFMEYGNHYTIEGTCYKITEYYAVEPYPFEKELGFKTHWVLDRTRLSTYIIFQ